MTTLIYIFLEKKIVTYTKNNIRAPSLQQVLRWARQLGVNNQDARAISDRAPYRHTMGQSQENTIQAGGGRLKICFLKK